MNIECREILVVTAHPSEGEAVRRAAWQSGCSCEVMVSGVGGAAMSWSLFNRLSGWQPAAAAGPSSGGTDTPSPPPVRPSLVIGAGIAGSYNPDIAVGSVVVTRSECFADLGIDDNGTFIPLSGAGLAQPDEPPFAGGVIPCTGRWYEMAVRRLPAVTAATVNTASGSPEAIARLRRTWDPGIETMEGAWLAYICARAGIPWLGVRAVSNMVEPRDTSGWNIPLALRRLQEEMTVLLKMMTAGG